MKYHLQSPPTLLSEEHRWLAELFSLGLQSYHLKKEEASLNEMAAFLKRLSPQHVSRIVLHSHHRLIRAFPVQGIHFADELPYIPGDYGKLKLSQWAYGLEEILSANPGLDYLIIPQSLNLHPLEIQAFIRGYRGKTQIMIQGNIFERSQAHWLSQGISDLLIHPSAWDLGPRELTRFYQSYASPLPAEA